MTPYTFQEKAIKNLLDNFKQLWQKPQNTELVFKSPTGSGKTFMMANFVNQLVNQPDWQEDVAFVWITFSDDLAMQSRDKFREYFFPNTVCRMLTVADFNDGILQKNDILFLNWQKLAAQRAESRVLRRPTDIQLYKESGYYFEDVIEKTHSDNRKIVLIIDESHTHVSDLAKRVVITPLNPKITIKVSATPFNDVTERDRFLGNCYSGDAALVEVKHEDVVAEGLIKEKIVFQTEEDLMKYANKDQDELLLDLAIKKRKELEAEYAAHNLKINPLVLIQLPSETAITNELGLVKEERVTQYLLSKGIDQNKIGYWLNGKEAEKKKLIGITNDDDPREFLLFKLAAGTGWDCPRADILVMYREIGSNTFYKQTLGRILRIPQSNTIHKLYAPKLKTGYCYTNYARNQVGVPEQTNSNKPFILQADSKYGEFIVSLYLKSDFESRVDYGDLADSTKFQQSLIKTFDTFFGIDRERMMYHEYQEQVKKKGIDLNPPVTNSIMVNAEVNNVDDLEGDFGGSDVAQTTSDYDIEQLFALACVQLLKEQTSDETKISNISRSWSPLKSALRVWLRANVNTDEIQCYRIFLNDLNKGANSVFRKVLTNALKDYRPILNAILKERESSSSTSEVFKIFGKYYYTEDYEEITLPSGNCILTPFYNKKEYNGKINEEEFIQFIDPLQHIKWWFKNGDYGREYLAFKYFNEEEHKDSLFYPDWFILMNDGRIGIFDTKGGITANQLSTKNKAEALARRIKQMNNLARSDIFFGGIIIKENGLWYYNDSETYQTFKENSTDWKLLSEVLDLNVDYSYLCNKQSISQPLLSVTYDQPYDSFGPNYGIDLTYDLGKDDLTYKITEHGMFPSSAQLTHQAIDAIKNYLKDSNNINNFFNKAHSTPDLVMSHVTHHSLSMKQGGQEKTVTNGKVQPWDEFWCKLCRNPKSFIE